MSVGVSAATSDLLETHSRLTSTVMWPSSPPTDEKEEEQQLDRTEREEIKVGNP